MSNSLGNQMSKFPALKKSDCEQIALVALNKRVTVSNLLMKKEWLCVKRSCSIKKSDMRDSLVIWANCLKKIIFSPFLCPRVKRSHRSSLSCSSLSCSLLSCSFLKSDRSDSLLSLLTKEGPWVDRSCRSFQITVPSLFTKEQQWAINFCCSGQKSDRSDLLFFKS